MDLDIDVVYLHLSPQALVSRDSHESRGRRARRCDCGLASRAFAAEALLPLSEFLQGVCPAMGGQGARLAPRGLGLTLPCSNPSAGRLAMWLLLAAARESVTIWKLAELRSG